MKVQIYNVVYLRDLHTQPLVNPFNREFSETDTPVTVFGHIHCCQKRHSSKSITEWLTVQILMSRFI